jgi:predicted DNA-binding transcriptional regulator YafY
MPKERTAYNQLKRTMGILRILSLERGPLTIEQLIQKLHDSEYGIDPDDKGQTPRNIHRDLSFLRDEMGYQIENIRGQGYLLQAKDKVLPLFFTKEELQALCLGRELFTLFYGTHFGDAIEKAYKTIEKIYKKSELKPNEKLLSYENAFIVQPGPTRRYDKKKDIIKKIFDSILENKEVEIKYTFFDNPEGAVLPIQPLKLLAYKESFYILGTPVSKEPKGIRMYLVDRIKDVTVTDKSFKPESTQEFEEKLKNSFGVLTDGKLTKVKIIFDKNLSIYLQERTWHSSQVFTETPKGIEMEMNILLNHEIVPWIIGFGKQVKKIEPKELEKLVEKERK